MANIRRQSNAWGWNLATLSICFSVVVAIGLLVWLLVVFYQSDRFLDNPLVSSSSSPNSDDPITEESFNGCVRNCTQCVKDKASTQNDGTQCKESCRCCNKYQGCIDQGNFLLNCAEDFISCKDSPPTRSGFGLPLCDLVTMRRIAGPNIIFALQACVDLGIFVTLPSVGGCCRNEPNRCFD